MRIAASEKERIVNVAIDPVSYTEHHLLAVRLLETASLYLFSIAKQIPFFVHYGKNSEVLSANVRREAKERTQSDHSPSNRQQTAISL
jgi:hypothetical protein